MKLKAEYQLSVLTEDKFAEQMPFICAQLEQCRQEGTFSGFDGKPLYYEYYQTEQSRGAVVLVHGLSEFTAKYHEFAWYLLNQGYDIFMYDQRCHGKSCRLTERNDLIHVDRFDDYVKDLHCSVQSVVRKATDLPLYLYGHSMGGATAALYLAQHPAVFQKAVLCAPMIEPLTGSVSPFVGRWGLTAILLFGNGKKKFWQSGEFDPNYTFAGSLDKSFARFQRNKQLRVSNGCYQTTPQTMRWAQQSLLVQRKLTNKAFVKRIQTPTLMLRPEKETVVSKAAQEKFLQICPACRQVTVPDATHNLLWGSTQTLTEVVQQVLDHFG